MTADLEPLHQDWGLAFFLLVVLLHEWSGADLGPADQCVLNTKVSTLTLNTPLIGPTSHSVAT